jgi:MFS family permease
MAVSNVALFGSSFLTPVIVGKITATMGWQWTFYLLAIFTGAFFPVVFFFVPETAYRRAIHLDTDMTGVQRHATPNGIAETDSIIETGGTDQDKENDPQPMQPPPQNPIPPKVSFAKSLMPFNGRKTDDSFWKLLFRPFPLFFHFGVLWVMTPYTLSADVN